jgi:glutathione S-transferase
MTRHPRLSTVLLVAWVVLAQAFSLGDLFGGVMSILPSGVSGGGLFRADVNGVIPSWERLEELVEQTEYSKMYSHLEEEWGKGLGPPHTDAKMRLFGQEKPVLTFYRDTAAWCAYSHRVIGTLEEKQIPHAVEKINMRSYGRKPDWYLSMVPSGLLPAIKIGDQLVTDSQRIMLMLDELFPNNVRKIMPDQNTREYDKTVRLLRLERELFSWWCQFVFRPGNSARSSFRQTLMECDSALGETPGPWFSGADGPDIVDLTFVPHIERMAASCMYWKGFKIRGNAQFPNVNAWFDALEKKDWYMAYKSDAYTHVMDIPPQYGNGHFTKESEDFRRAIDGEDGSWDLPLKPLQDPEAMEPVLPENDPGEIAARAEAALKLVRNHKAVVRFAARGAGRASGWNLLPGRAPLSDPDAVPSEEAIPDVDVLLRTVAAALLNQHTGDDDTAARENLAAALSAASTNDSKAKEAAAACVEYLKRRVGVPRDMSYPAARQFRAYLNWAQSCI